MCKARKPFVVKNLRDHATELGRQGHADPVGATDGCPIRLVINCADPDRLARFLAVALGYELEPPPAGFATWDDWRREIGLSEDYS